MGVAFRTMSRHNPRITRNYPASPQQRDPGWFEAALNVAERLKGKIGVLLVANVKGRTTPLDDYSTDSVITEFLSNSELDDFVSGFEQAGIYCEVVLDEHGFIHWLNNGEYQFARDQALVYNLAQNGTGPARLTLVPGLCRLHHIPLLDSDGYAAALDQHKFHAISLLENFGLPVARCWCFSGGRWLTSAPPDGLKVIAKPTYECASIGIHAENIFRVDSAIHERLNAMARCFRQPITVQEFVSGFEVEVPVLEAEGPRTCMAVGIEVQGRRNLEDTILVYEDVFGDGYTFYNFANESKDAAIRMMQIAEHAYTGLQFSAPSRIDFRVSGAGQIKIMEVTCKPHVTMHSSFMYSQKAMGHSHSDLLKFLVGSAAHRHGIR